MGETSYFFWAPINTWLNVILITNIDAFFASVMQSVYLSLRGKPVIVGQE
jgi:hypothetical protein